MLRLFFSSTISKLPALWQESDGYDELLERLRLLSARRAELQKKLMMYRQLQSLTKPFRGPQTSIQPNLVTRDGPLTKEMERNVDFGIRLAGALAGRKRRRDAEEGAQEAYEMDLAATASS
jgi:hypothetical protein